jgi:hypothetical protein
MRGREVLLNENEFTERIICGTWKKSGVITARIFRKPK